MSRTCYAAGNWKMHGTSNAPSEIDSIGARARKVARIRTVIFPPSPLIDRARHRGVYLGGQDCRPEPKGAHAGDIFALHDVKGGLVEGTSLGPLDFIPIMQALADRKGQHP